MSAFKRVLKNSAYVFSSKTLSRLVYTGFVVYAASRLGPAAFGALSFALVMVELASAIGDMGLTRYGSRELVRSWADRARLSGIILVLEILTSMVFSLGGVLIVLLASPSSPQRELLLLGMVPVFLSGFVNTAESLFIASENFFSASLFNFLGRIIFVAAGFAVLSRGGSPMAVMWGFTAGVVAESLLRLFYVSLKLTRFSFRFPAAAVSSMLLKALPFATAAAASIAFLQVGVVVLRLLEDDTAVGVFNMANVLFIPFVWISVTLGRTIFPSFVSQHAADEPAARASTWQWHRFMALSGIPVAVLVSFLAAPVLSHFSSYAGSAAALTILIWSLPLMMISSVDFNVLQVVNLERAASRALILTTLATIILSVAFILPWGIRGAALATLAGSMIRFLQFHYLVRKYFTGKGMLELLLRPVAAGAVMAGVIYLLGGFNIWLAAVIGSGAYVAVVLASGAVRIAELKTLAGRA